MSGAYTEVFAWTEARVAELRGYWTDGLSASQIAAKFENGLSRNAVLGKAWRLDLPERKRTPPAKVARRSTRNYQELRYTRPAVIQPLPKPKTEVVHIVRVKSIFDLKANHCRWPIGDPQSAEFGYCGADKCNPNVSYCAMHAKLAYTKPSDQRP